MKLLLLFVISFILPVLILNPMTKREVKISLGHCLVLFIGSVFCYFAWIIFFAFLHISIDKVEANRLLIGTFSGMLLALCLTNYEVWSYINPAIKAIIRNVKFATINYIYPAIKFTVLKIIIPAAKFSALKLIQFFKLLIALAKNKKLEPGIREEIIKESPPENKKQEEQIKPMTRKEKSVQDVLNKLDNF